MKKFWAILFLNISLLILFFLVIDFFIFLSDAKFHYKVDFKTYLKDYVQNFNANHNFLPVRPKNHILDQGYANSEEEPYYWKKYRKIENPQNEKTIVIFGCSFAYGYNLMMNETFSHFLGKNTNYRVYNQSFNARSVQHMLYQLENDDFYKIIPHADYVILVFFPDQIRRTWFPSMNYDTSIYYEEGNNHLYLKKYSLKYLRSYITGRILNFINRNFNKDFSDKEINLYFLHIDQSLYEIKKHWGNDTKFIFFAYENIENNETFKKHIKKLQNNGGIIVTQKDLSSSIDFSDQEYKLQRDLHPNKKAWAELTPLFVKYLQNKGELK